MVKRNGHNRVTSMDSLERAEDQSMSLNVRRRTTKAIEPNLRTMNRSGKRGNNSIHVALSKLVRPKIDPTRMKAPHL